MTDDAALSPLRALKAHWAYLTLIAGSYPEKCEEAAGETVALLESTFAKYPHGEWSVDVAKRLRDKSKPAIDRVTEVREDLAKVIARVEAQKDQDA
jgi:hypothetical protein